MLDAHVPLDPLDALYIAALLGDQRRPIDGYIDYFGGRRPRLREAMTPSGVERAGAVADVERWRPDAPVGIMVTAAR